jgi:ribosome-associated protein
MGGFVYIMSNPSFRDGRLKIGKSDRDPDEFRRTELETTGVPEPFRLEYYAFVDDHHELEQLVHQHFAEFRPNPRREFFLVPAPKVVEFIKTRVRIKFEVNNTKTFTTTDEFVVQPHFRLMQVLRSTLELLKAENIIELNISEFKNNDIKWMIICSGRSPRHVKEIAHHAMESVRDELTVEPIIEGVDVGDWVLLDYQRAGVVVHVFRPEVRAYYRLEEKWGKR